MKKLVAIIALGSLTAFGDQEAAVESSERGKWRLTVGASVIGGIRPKVGPRAQQMVGLSGFGSAISRTRGLTGRSKSEAYDLGSGDANGGRRIFDGGAWYDPTDSAHANDPDWSWNWRLHDPVGLDPDGCQGFIERTAYAGEAETVARQVAGAGEGNSSDGSEWFPGLRVEAAYELYRSEGERPWGIDAAVAFAYYFQRNLWKASGVAAQATSDGHREEGYYEWWNDSEDTAQYIFNYDRDTQFHDGMWGAGSFYGPGAELLSDAWKYRDHETLSENWHEAHTLSYRGSGDYREYSVELLARPWWEPWEWLRVFASLGLEISRREFEWSMSAHGTDGSVYGESGKEKNWRAVGLFGGGVSLYWHDFILAGEALWRFGGKDLEVDGKTVDGKIKHGNWGFRLLLGYEF